MRFSWYICYIILNKIFSNIALFLIQVSPSVFIILGLLLRYKYNLEREKARLTAYKKKIENKSDANTTQSTKNLYV